MLVQDGAGPRVFSATSNRLPFYYEDLGLKQKFQGRKRITGSLSQAAEGIRPASGIVAGSISMEASPANLHYWLPKAMWRPIDTVTTPGSDVYTLGTDPADYFVDVIFHKTNGVFRYTDLLVDKLIIQGQSSNGGDPGQQEPELCELIVSFVGVSENSDAVAAWPGTLPALGTTSPYQPYAIWESTLMFDGVATKYQAFQWGIDNRLDVKNYNSITPSCFRSMGRKVFLKTRGPFVCDTLTSGRKALDEGVAAQLLFTSTLDPMSCLFNMPIVRNNYETPATKSKGEIPFELDLEAFSTGGLDNELVVTNDWTP
jgi:hypothetical protein